MLERLRLGFLANLGSSYSGDNMDEHDNFTQAELHHELIARVRRELIPILYRWNGHPVLNLPWMQITPRDGEIIRKSLQKTCNSTYIGREESIREIIKSQESDWSFLKQNDEKYFKAYVPLRNEKSYFKRIPTESSLTMSRESSESGMRESQEHNFDWIATIESLYPIMPWLNKTSAKDI